MTKDRLGKRPAPPHGSLYETAVFSAALPSASERNAASSFRERIPAMRSPRQLMSFLARSLGIQQCRDRRAKRPRGYCPRMETLEDRSVPSTLTVVNVNDQGAGSLRQAIQDAQSGDTITFNLPTASTITLVSGDLEINKNLTIEAPANNAVTIDAANQSSVLVIEGGRTVSLSNLDIANGTASQGGGILNDGTLTASNCTLSGNSSADGGGIFNGGALTVTNCTLSENQAAEGGGIFNEGTLTVLDSTLYANGHQLHHRLQPGNRPGRRHL
jgi:hypothetical protein